MRIDGLRPFYTFIAFGDKWLEMAWCNDAITYALHFYGSITGQTITLDELLDKAAEPRHMQALCFGAIRARSPINVDTFEAIYDPQPAAYAVTLGLKGYLPSMREKQQFYDLDESYPEVEQTQKSGPVDMGSTFRALKKLGYTADEIGAMTWDGMLGALDADKEDDRWDLPWLGSNTTG